MENIAETTMDKDGRLRCPEHVHFEKRLADNIKSTVFWKIIGFGATFISLIIVSIVTLHVRFNTVSADLSNNLISFTSVIDKGMTALKIDIKDVQSGVRELSTAFHKSEERSQARLTKLETHDIRHDDQLHKIQREQWNLHRKGGDGGG